jgi:hypothetical protein
MRINPPHCVLLIMLIRFGKECSYAAATQNVTKLSEHLPVTMAARSKAWVCDRSLAGIAGSNPTGGVDACLLSVVCCQKEVSASG